MQRAHKEAKCFLCSSKQNGMVIYGHSLPTERNTAHVSMNPFPLKDSFARGCSRVFASPFFPDVVCSLKDFLCNFYFSTLPSISTALEYVNANIRSRFRENDCVEGAVVKNFALTTFVFNYFG